MARALAHMQAAVETGSAEPEVWSKTAWLLLQAGRLTKAADHFRQALGGNADDPDALMGLGRVLLEQDQHAEAVDALEYSVRIRPDYPATLPLLMGSAQPVLTASDWTLGVVSTVMGILLGEYGFRAKE